MKKMPLRIAFAGERDIAVSVLKFILAQGVKPLALILPNPDKSTHGKELISLCPYLSKNEIFYGDEFRQKKGIEQLKKLDLDYILSIHFPYIYTKETLTIAKKGVLNLHPAFLPYNRGWHTAAWAIIEGTPYGATLHFMDENLDSGDIVLQERIEIRDGDTTDTLYKRTKELELELFKKAWPSLVSFSYVRKSQKELKGTAHKKSDLASIQKIDLEKPVKGKELLDKLRALTTNVLEEAAYYEMNGKRYRVQIKITPED